MLPFPDRLSCNGASALPMPAAARIVRLSVVMVPRAPADAMAPPGSASPAVASSEIRPVRLVRLPARMMLPRLTMSMPPVSWPMKRIGIRWSALTVCVL